MLIAQRGDLFVYGTLQFPEVLHVLIGRIPQTSPAALAGWRAAALDRRTYPGLVAADATATGRLLTGLTANEAQVLDEYESGPYELRELTTIDGRPAWCYVWNDDSAVLAVDWSAAEFAIEHLPHFVGQVSRWLAERSATSVGGRTAARPHDPEVAG